MTAEYLLLSIGGIDDALVVEAAAPPRRHTALWLRWGALAAAAALCVGLAGLRPILSSRKGAPAPMAAESGGSLPADEENRALGSARNAQSADRAPAAVVGDVCKPTFFLNGTVYHITGFEDDLPDGCTPLGELEALPAAASKSSSDGAEAQGVLVNDDQLAGRAVWRSESGDLFIALDGGGYARATASTAP